MRESIKYGNIKMYEVYEYFCVKVIAQRNILAHIILLNIMYFAVYINMKRFQRGQKLAVISYHYYCMFE